MRVSFIGRGGSGKTAIAAIVSLVLGSSDRDIIAMDADLTTANLTAILYGYERKPPRSLNRFLLGEVGAGEVIVEPRPAMTYRYDKQRPPERAELEEALNLHLIPADQHGIMEIASMDPQAILDKLNELWDEVERRFRDPLMIIDTPAGVHTPLSSLAIALAAYTDKVVPVVTPDINTVVAVAQAVKELEKYGIETLTVILNGLDVQRPYTWIEGEPEPIHWEDFVKDVFGRRDIFVVPFDMNLRKVMESSVIPVRQILQLAPTKALSARARRRKDLYSMILSLETTSPRARVPEGMVKARKVVESVFAPVESTDVFAEIRQRLLQPEGVGAEEGVGEELAGAEVGEGLEVEEARVEEAPRPVPVQEEATPSRPARARRRRSPIKDVKELVEEVGGEEIPSEEVVLVTGRARIKVNRKDILNALEEAGAPRSLIKKFLAEEVNLDELMEEGGTTAGYIEEALDYLGLPVAGRSARLVSEPEPVQMMGERVTRREEVKEERRGLADRILGIFKRDRGAKPRLRETILIYPDGTSVKVRTRKLVRALKQFGLDDAADHVKSGGEFRLDELPGYGDVRLNSALRYLNLPTVGAGRGRDEGRRERGIRRRRFED